MKGGAVRDSRLLLLLWVPGCMATSVELSTMAKVG
jgi:hypothetical protein